MDWIINNWEWCLLGFMVAEKLVKMTPNFPYDDIILDMCWKNLKKLAKK